MEDHRTLLEKWGVVDEVLFPFTMKLGELTCNDTSVLDMIAKWFQDFCEFQHIKCKVKKDYGWFSGSIDITISGEGYTRDRVYQLKNILDGYLFMIKKLVKGDM